MPLTPQGTKASCLGRGVCLRTELCPASCPRSLPLTGSQVMGCGGLTLPEDHFPSHSTGAAPPSFFLLLPVLTHHQGEGLCPGARPGIRGIYKSRLLQAPASCLIATCCHTMLGGLGKLAAEGLAHRTEKATEEAGEGPGAPSPSHCSSRWGLRTDLTGPVKS